MKSLKWHYFGNKGAYYFTIHENFDSDEKRLCAIVWGKPEEPFEKIIDNEVLKYVKYLLLSGGTDQMHYVSL